MTPRIAFVVQRYGENISGGSEMLCRQVAERLVPYYTVEVLTSTATDHLSWKNALPAGVESLNGVSVRRFPCEDQRQEHKFHAIYGRIFQAHLSRQEEEQMLRYQGPYCPKLISWLRDSSDRYDAYVFFTYLYYPTCIGLPLVKSRAIFVPTAHDEPALYLHLLDDLFHPPPRLFFNSEEERLLVQRRFSLHSKAGRIVGAGVETNANGSDGAPDPAWETLRGRLQGSQVLTYTGRIEDGKGCEELVDFFLRYVAATSRTNVMLLLLGRRTLPIPDHPQLLSPGYVSEWVKHQALLRSDLILAPSPVESLCLSALEGMLLSRPLLVNGRCDVLTGHCVRSNGGLWYRNYEEFSEALSLLLRDSGLRETLGRNGAGYVRRNYRWDEVVRAYREELDEIIAEGRRSK